MLRAAATADAGDQRDVGDEPVHRAEYGRPQPSAGHVPMLGTVVGSRVNLFFPRCHHRKFYPALVGQGSTQRSPAKTGRE